MAITLVTARARTKGKTPQNFTYQAVGTLTERTIEGNPEKGVPDSVVDDASVDSLADADFDEIAALFGEFTSENCNLSQTVNKALAAQFNILSRRKASPVAEVADREDELTPIINALVAAGIVKAEDVGTLRRTVTMTAGLNEVSRLEALESSKFYRQAVKAGVKF